MSLAIILLSKSFFPFIQARSVALLNFISYRYSPNKKRAANVVEIHTSMNFICNQNWGHCFTTAAAMKMER